MEVTASHQSSYHTIHYSKIHTFCSICSDNVGQFLSFDLFFMHLWLQTLLIDWFVMSKLLEKSQQLMAVPWWFWAQTRNPERLKHILSWKLVISQHKQIKLKDKNY